MDKSDKKELKSMGKKKFIAMEKKDISEAKKAKDKKKKGGHHVQQRRQRREARSQHDCAHRGFA